MNRYVPESSRRRALLLSPPTALIVRRRKGADSSSPGVVALEERLDPPSYGKADRRLTVTRVDLRIV
jgi:hypothetical protein